MMTSVLIHIVLSAGLKTGSFKSGTSLGQHVISWKKTSCETKNGRPKPSWYGLDRPAKNFFAPLFLEQASGLKIGHISLPNR